jgi:endonuclease YncB( thermonuclease family)
VVVYEYRATIIDVVDGDTVHAEVDLGCDTSIKLAIRLAAINAPELHVGGELNQAGTDARQHLIELLRSEGADESIPPVVML